MKPIALVQASERHDETLFFSYHLLKKAGFEPSLYLFPTLLKRRPWASLLGSQVALHDVNTLESHAARFEQIFVNSDRDLFEEPLIGLPHKKIVLVHRPQFLLPGSGLPRPDLDETGKLTLLEDAGNRFVFTTRHGLDFFREQLCQRLPKANWAAIDRRCIWAVPCYPEKRPVAVVKEPIFLSVGRMEKAEYQTVVHLAETFPQAQFWIARRRRPQAGPVPGNLTLFIDLDNRELDMLVAKCRFLLKLSQDAFYQERGFSGTLGLSLRFGRPMICPKAIARNYHTAQGQAICLAYGDHDASAGISTALAMTADGYGSYRRALQTFLQENEARMQLPPGETACATRTR